MNPTMENAIIEWETIYAEALGSEQTLTCYHCGDTYYGNAPEIVIMCWTCWNNTYEEK